MGTWLKRLGLVVLAALIGGAIYMAMREQPVPVDIATVLSGPLEVTIEEEGVTRVRDIYTVSSPIAGHLDRITLEEGDPVKARETIVASIHPPDPPFLDERTLAELKAAIEAARTAVSLAETQRQQAQTALYLARSEFDRTRKLAESKIVSTAVLERARSEVDVRIAEVESARATIQLRKAELASAEARLTQPGSNGVPTDIDGCCVDLTAPVDGIVLKVISRSEQSVVQGTKIAEIGDPRNLEIKVDLLSSDAARLKPGTRAVITGWGGSDIAASLRRIEPAGFTKVSALGIEEQRVSAVLDPDETPAELGHGYRVIVRLVIWSADNVLQVPIGALFRSGGQWSVFVVEDGKAVTRAVEVDHLNSSHAEIMSGLEDGERVVLYPSDLIGDGSAVLIRN